ncbi:MAG: hypothetical protein ACI8TQ_003954 [Planctomycetota bacterium]
MCSTYNASMQSRRVSILAILFFGFLWPSSCAEPTRKPSSPVVIVGIDGLEPTLVAELIAAGRMPNLASFVKTGVIGRLASMIPTYSPVIWTSIATGQHPSEHGITFFHDAENRPYTSNTRKVPALWNIVSDAGLGVNCVGWWNTWPAEPINGYMLSSYAAQAQAQLIWKPGVWENLEDQTWPNDLWKEIKSDMVFVSDATKVRDLLWDVFPAPHDQDSATPEFDLDPVTQKSVTDLGWTFAADLSSAAVAVHLQEQYATDLSLVYLAMTDVAGHRFWNYHEPTAYSYELNEPAKSDFAEYVNLSYVETDRMLGELLATLPANANVLVLSDHGMHPDPIALDDPESGTSGHHREGRAGIFAAKGPLVQSLGNLLEDPTRGELGHVLEVAPLVLHMLSIPVPEHWPALAGSMRLEQVLDESWRRTHPLEKTANVDAKFRPATPAKIPFAKVDQDFMESFSGIGYILGNDAREESESSIEDQKKTEVE